MARSINRLTAGHVAKVKTPGSYADGGGLLLRIAPGGSKQWQFRYRFGGRERYMGLGGVQTVSLADAREAALQARKSLLDGHDPIEERRMTKRQALLAQATSITFTDACREYLAAHSSSWRNAKHREQWQRTLEMYAFPVIGDLAVRDIDMAAVLRVLDPIWRDKTETASRLRQRIEKVLDWAAVRGYREGENPARWRGHLETQLPKLSKRERVKHMPALPYEQIGDFISALREREGVSALALEFTILTAARTGEVIGARWDEMDLARAVWTVPAERMKAAREHAVPLSERALKVLTNLRELSTCDTVVFPAPRGGPMSNMAMLQLLKRMGRSDITVHGFRSTFRDWAGDCTAYPREVAEGCLAHTVQGVEAAYRRSDALEKRRRLLGEWARFCDAPKREGAIVQISEGARA